MSNVGNWPRGGRVAWVWPVAVACSLALGACGGGSSTGARTRGGALGAKTPAEQALIDQWAAQLQ